MKIPKHSPGSVLFALLSWTAAASAAAPPEEATLYVKAGVLKPVRLFLPPDRDPRRPEILVVALHGRGGSIHDMARLWELFKAPRFILAVAEAPYPLAGGWSWDFPSRDRRLWEIADPLIPEYILSVIESVKRQYPVASVYLLGHSQGVSYAYLTGLLNPAIIRGLACFAGFYPGEFLPAEKVQTAAERMRFFIAHGRGDAAVDIAASKRARDILENLGATVNFFIFSGGHALTEEALREAQKWIEADPQGKASLLEARKGVERR